MILNFAQIFRVLAFGASQTEGFTGGGPTHPYAPQLQAPLASFFAANDRSKPVDVKITIDGVGGDRVISPPGRFLPRLKGDFDAAPQGAKYDWVLVLGGTNDLGAGSKANDIYDGLKKVWNVALGSGANVLAITILESSDPNPDLIQRRKSLNSAILNHKQNNVYPFDLSSAIPYFSLDEKRRKEIWANDGLHLTAKGYDLAGQKIAEKLIAILKTRG